MAIQTLIDVWKNGATERRSFFQKARAFVFVALCPFWGVLFVGLGLLVVQASTVAAARAADFRLENAVYTGNQREPSSESVTIFHGGIVYDCMKSPAEVVVFDKPQGRFVLLNMAAQKRSELTTHEVAAFADRLRQLAAKSRDAVVRFLADPKFQERFDEPSGELIFHSPWVDYRLTFAAEEDLMIVEQYREFSDWYVRLNALLVPSARPPGGRLAVNAALAQRKALPTQVVLTLSQGKGAAGHQASMRSTHRLIRSLTADDLDRVAQIREAMGHFKSIGFEQYRKSFGDPQSAGK